MSAHQTWFGRSIASPAADKGRPGARGGARWCAAPDRLPQAPSGASDARPGVGRSARPRGAGEAPSDGRRKTGTSGTARRSAASAPASPRSPPSARSRARSARATAGGIAGSGSAPGGRAPSSRGAPTGSSTGPARQKIPLHDQLPDLGVKIADLALMVPDPPLGALREHLDQTLHRLALPCARPGSDGPGAARRSPEASGRPEAPPAPPSPSAPPKISVACCSSAFLRQAVEYTLARTFGANLLI